MDLTILAASSENIELTALAMRHSSFRIENKDRIFITDKEVSGPFTRLDAPKYENREDNWNWCWFKLPELIQTTHELSIQYDGYVIDGDMWTDNFYHYDYIGSKWPWYSHHRVGNGGFCLRSKRLLMSLTEFPAPGSQPDDDYICRTLRPELESMGMVFAPEPVADMFSYERHVPMQRTLGFHGLFNMWRHVDDVEMIEMLPKFADYVRSGSHWIELAEAYKVAGNMKMHDAVMAMRM